MAGKRLYIFYTILYLADPLALSGAALQTAWYFTHYTILDTRTSILLLCLCVCQAGANPPEF